MELSEAIEKCRVDDVFLCEGPRPPQKGSLALIGHHLIFSPTSHHQQQESTPTSSNGTVAKGTTAADGNELWLLHRAVDRVLVEPISRDPNAKQGAYLRLKCKNFMHLCFEVNDLADCHAVGRSIEKLSNLHGIEHDYPFYYRCPFTVLDNGWEAFSLEQQFAQLQMHTKDKWRISAVNRDFEVCPSYPEMVIVPAGIGDDYLRISATFRDGGRFPVLSYYHHKTRSCIFRCGQPLIGPTNRRCKEDEVILNALLSKFSKGLIYDTRPKLTAQASRGKGGGCESQMFYSQWKYLNGNLPKIRDLQESLARLIDACIENSPDKWLAKLASSGWLQYIVDSLTGAATVAQVVHCMDEGTAGEVPVLVHGFEGTDSTLLITALAQFILDPDARTIRGFQSLIENEWILAGHPFSLRCAHSAFATGSVTGPYESPVFLCFLDCIWQIMRQYPSCLEFNERFLIFLFEHAYASEFGSFLGNNEQERHQFGVKKRTTSLWSYANHPAVLPVFLNALYEPYEQPVWPSVAPQSVVLWNRMYFRWQRNWTDTDRCQKMFNEWCREEKELRARMFSLQQQQGGSAMSMSACSTITSSSLHSAAHTSSATIPSSTAAESMAKPNYLGPPGRILPPPFALEEMVKMDKLNIRTPDEEDSRADGFDILGGGSTMGGEQTLFGGGARVRWGRERNNNAAMTASAVLDGAKQLFQRLGGPSGYF